MQKYTLLIIIILGVLYHTFFFWYNTILTESDSFAYIRMAEWLLRLSSDGLGNGWFGFIYSTFLAIFLPFFESDILAGQAANMLLLIISGLLFYSVSRKVLSIHWSLFTLVLFLFHPSFIYYRIHLLAENIYIPIFLAIILITWDFIETLIRHKENIIKTKLLREKNITRGIGYLKYPLLLWIFLGLLYLTRAEWFIYMGSIGIIAVFLLFKKYLSLETFLVTGSIFFLGFFTFITPYLFHLHSLTGEWGLTNKWASNWRQAELRGRDHMDDLGFEEAVAGLTEDKTSLIAGFAWGMPYFQPQIEGGFLKSLKENPLPHIKRVWENQYKLYTQNLPEIYFWNSYKLFKSDDTRFQSIFFQIFLLLLGLPLLLGIIISCKKHLALLGIFFAFFLPASIFFTLFFTLNRYFIIFLPFLLLFTVIWIQRLTELFKIKSIIFKYIFLIIFLVLFTLNTTFSQYNFLSLEKEKNNFYMLKKEAWEWLYEKSQGNKEIKVLERFPFTTYYSGAQWRYITPYTQEIEDIKVYMLYHDIDFLIVDSMDFYTYRPDLRKYLEEIPEWLRLVRDFTNTHHQKIRIFELQSK